MGWVGLGGLGGLGGWLDGWVGGRNEYEECIWCAQRLIFFRTHIFHEILMTQTVKLMELIKMMEMMEMLIGPEQ